MFNVFSTSAFVGKSAIEPQATFSSLKRTNKLSKCSSWLFLFKYIWASYHVWFMGISVKCQLSWKFVPVCLV